MATLKNSPKIKLRVALFLAGVTLIALNSCALAHTDVTVEQAKDLIDSTDDLVVVDVREQYEYCDERGHIPGALNYPLSSGVLEARYEELPKDNPILVVCRSGGRSNAAANFLDPKGFSMIYDMMGGMTAWLWETEPCKQDDDNETDSTETNTYVFLPEKSTLIQTGGIAGVNWNYTIEGHFRLTVDKDAGAASFTLVGAKATDESSLERILDPNQVFNMSSLSGKVIDEMTISFTGNASDGSDIEITTTFQDNLVNLAGQTTPPANSADFFIFNLDAVAHRKYNGGTGEPNNPYLIYTAEQMNAIGAEPNDWDKHFKLMVDIDLSSYTGKDFNIIGYYLNWDDNKPFTGVFDGNNHTISNFSYTTAYADEIGLFGCVNGDNARIKNLGLIDPNVDVETGIKVGTLVGWLRYGAITDCYVESGRVSGFQYVGGLVGFSTWKSIINNCYATAVVLGVEDVGGLVGANNSIITNCYEIGNITGHRRLGALVGSNEGPISNCYSTGSVSGDRFIGGLVGQNGVTYSEREGMTFPGDIDNCYSTGFVSGWSNLGGLVGLHNAGTIDGCFWDIETSGQTTSDGGIGKTTADMQMASTFLEAGWDFVDETENGTDDIWWILEDRDYPRLFWELMPEN